MDTKSIIGILVIYLMLFMTIKGFRNGGLQSKEMKTYWLIGILWGLGVFIGNFVLYKIGVMSFTPWILNGLHTFIWIGLVLSYLYITTRMQTPIWRQVLYFIVFSFIVKYAEKIIFNSWEHDHFFWVFKGNFAYILGWSIMDGLYPFITKFGLRLLSRRMSGLLI